MEVNIAQPHDRRDFRVIKNHDADGNLTDEVVAHCHYATPAAVATVLAQPITLHGRSPWTWLRLPNGDLMLGVFPRGDTYFAVEYDAEWKGSDGLAC